MLLQVLLLASTGVAPLHGGPPTVVYHNLQCVNDYLYTINCTLSIQQPDSRSSYWLTFTEAYDRSVFTCPLKGAREDFSCSLTTYDDEEATFSDLDRYEMSLCRGREEEEEEEEGPDVCEPLRVRYNPARNIKPNAPRRLHVRANSSRHLFTWTSTYEPYGDVTSLGEALVYQLRYLERGLARDGLSRVIHTPTVNYSVDDENFAPNTKYAARVRSSPDQAFFKGQWSDWSPEVCWETQPAAKGPPPNTRVPGLVKVLVPLCVVVSFALLVGYASVKRWSQGSFIPTPALYFLTPDSPADFKSWAVTEENTADMLKAEEILLIDTFTECDAHEEEEEEEEESPDQFHHQFRGGSAYNNIGGPGCYASLLGVPYAASSMAPPSLTEGDSGCWLGKYSNEYCTLSAFQEKGPTGAGGPTAAGSTGSRY
ncbi:interleukin-21 receptor [Spinachia spinachia]